MIEKQLTEKCSGCGYPIDMSEHAPDCPNVKGKPELTEAKEKTTVDVLDTLNPEKIEDVEGVERNIYTFKTNEGKEAEVLFYSPDELPYSKELVQGRQGFIIGDKPKLRKEEEWNQFVNNIRSGSEKDVSPSSETSPVLAEARQEGKLSFFVESSPRALLDLAFQLGIEDKQLRELRKKMSHKEMTNEGEEMMDKIIASKVISEDGEFRFDRNTDGEALFILALQGDEQAGEILDKKLEKMKEKDREREENLNKIIAEQGGRGEKSAGEKESLKLDSLVAVHATGYRPHEKDGSLNIKSTFDGTGWSDPHNTVHFALNHHVASHMYGGWDSQPYVVLSPLKEVINSNKRPDALNTVDTYFEVSPGRTLSLPKEKSRSVEPADLPPGVLFETNKDGKAVYKKGNYTPEDYEALWQALGESARYNFDQNISSTIKGAIDSYDYETRLKDHEKLSALSSKITDKVIAVDQEAPENTYPAQLFDGMRKEEPAKVIDSFFQEMGIADDINNEIRKKIIERIDGKVFAEIKDMAVNNCIQDMGFEKRRGGMWAWGDSWTVTSQTQFLGAEIGSPVGAHTNFPKSTIDGKYRGGWESGKGILNELREGDINIKQYRELTERVNEEHLHEMTPETRRMLYLRGVI